MREQRGDKIHSLALVHLVRSRGVAAKPRNRALEGRSIVFPLVPICKRACMGTNEKTIATVVATVSRLGGEDKTFRLSFSKKQSLKIRYLAFGKEPNFNNYCL